MPELVALARTLFDDYEERAFTRSTLEIEVYADQRLLLRRLVVEEGLRVVLVSDPSSSRWWPIRRRRLLSREWLTAGDLREAEAAARRSLDEYLG